MTNTQIKQPVKWVGIPPTHCEICNKPLATTFTDGTFGSTGHWAIFCPLCYSKLGGGYGTGRGQQYDLKTLENTLG